MTRGSKKSQLGEGRDRLPNDQMVENLHPDQVERCLQSSGRGLVCFSRRSNTRRMIMGQDDPCGIAGQGFFDYLSSVHLSGIDRSAKQLDVLDQPMMCVKKEGGKHLISTRPPNWIFRNRRTDCGLPSTIRLRNC